MEERAVPRDRRLSVLKRTLAAEWHPQRNGALRPKDVSVGSRRYVWWKCRRNPKHEWRAKIDARTRYGTGCPVCAGRVVHQDTSLARRSPAIAREWHPTRNESTPASTHWGSTRKAWWRCSANPAHEWSAVVRNRTVHRRGCPYCAGRTITVETSLATQRPETASEWHPTRNGSLRPSDVATHAARRVWWRCARCGYEWKTSICNRTKATKPTGCAACTGRQATSANSLSALHPRILCEWHPTKNGRIQPSEVRPGSLRRVWWRCARSSAHEWQASILSRTAKGSGCPFCSGRLATASTSLAATHPQVASEWHPTRNGERTPHTVKATSAVRAWWQCRHNVKHVWCALIANRTRGRACPMCSGRDDLTWWRSPPLAREWHPTFNGNVTPKDVSPLSSDLLTRPVLRVSAFLVLTVQFTVHRSGFACTSSPGAFVAAHCSEVAHSAPRRPGLLPVVGRLAAGARNYPAYRREPDAPELPSSSRIRDCTAREVRAPAREGRRPQTRARAAEERRESNGCRGAATNAPGGGLRGDSSGEPHPGGQRIGVGARTWFILLASPKKRTGLGPHALADNLRNHVTTRTSTRGKSGGLNFALR